MNETLSCTQTQLQTLFGVSRKTILQWRNEADPLPVYERKGNRLYFDAASCVKWYVEYQINLRLGETPERDKRLNATQEKAKLAKAQRARIDLEVRTKKGQLIPLDVAASWWNVPVHPENSSNTVSRSQPYITMMQAIDHQIKPQGSSDIIHHTIDFSSFLTDARIDTTYNRTPFEPKPWFCVDKPNPTLYN